MEHRMILITLGQLRSDIFHGFTLIKDAKDEQNKMKEEMAKLENCNPINKKKVDTRSLKKF